MTQLPSAPDPSAGPAYSPPAQVPPPPPATAQPMWSAPPAGPEQPTGSYPSAQYPGAQYPGAQYPFGQQYPATQPYPGATPYPQPGSPYQPFLQQPLAVSGAALVIRWLMAAACALVVICAFLPWATASVYGSSASVSGTDDGRDGWITLAMALVAGIVAVISAANKRPGGIHLAAGIVGTIMGALISIVGVVDLVDINDKDNAMTGYDANISPGFGLVCTIVFGIVVLGLGVAALAKRT